MTEGDVEDRALRYALVTPARNETANLRRLAGCVMTQTAPPATWTIVDNGSTDETGVLASDLASAHAWISVVSVPGENVPVRGGAVVRAFTAGLRDLPPRVDIVVKLDADVSFEPDHFERLLAEFSRDPRLGIAGSLCLEEEGGAWRPRYTTRSHVRGAVRAYRRACLDDVLPLEERMGWDGIDEIKAAIKGWRTATIPDIAFRHHRALGGREPARAKWVRQGEMAHYMGYRPSYLAFRALYRALREPSALAMIYGYAAAAVRRKPRVADAEVRSWLRREQSVRRLPTRAREALGRPGS
jgi:glycosyltransferase involved in cell wall biosynthesis